jgi:thiopurine S-methyltransferase
MRHSSSARPATTLKSSATNPTYDDTPFWNKNVKAEYWLQRWKEGRTGWHHTDVMPLLEQHWGALGVGRGTRVLVPLCGKSLDMLWLARQGLDVLGAEISPLAVETFLAENRLQATQREAADGTHYRVAGAGTDGDIEIINGDVFGVASGELEACGAFYDRAALIAFPAPMRDRLAREVYAKLPAGARGLLITLEYPEGETEAPPFSVDEAEVQRLFEAQWDIRQIERRDILASQPSFSERGVTALHTAVYALTRHR